MRFIVEWGIPPRLETAIEQVRATVEIGATHAKWQHVVPRELASTEAERYWSPSLGGSPSQLETFKRAGGLEPSEWAELFVHCRGEGIMPVATPFAFESVEVLYRAGVAAYKIASGDVTFRALWQAVGQSDVPVFFSAGAASGVEIERAAGWIPGAVPMACDLIYPTGLAQTGFVRQIPRLKQHARGGDVGYSDHTREIETGACAVMAGATVLEKHVTLNPTGRAPDDKMALTVNAAKHYWKLAQSAAKMLEHPTGDPQAPARYGARRSAYARRELTPGTVLNDRNIAWLRPAAPGSIGPADGIEGRKMTRRVRAGTAISLADLI